MNQTQKIREHEYAIESKEEMKKYFQDVLNGKLQSEHNFLQNWFNRNNQKVPAGMNLKSSFSTGDYERVNLVNYKNMVYVIGELGDEHYSYCGELVDFVEKQAKKHRITMEGFITNYFPYYLAYTLSDIRQALKDRIYVKACFINTSEELIFFWSWDSRKYYVEHKFKGKSKDIMIVSEIREEATDKFLEVLNQKLGEDKKESVYFI